MSKHNRKSTQKQKVPMLAKPSVPPVDPLDVFTKAELETVLRFLRRKVTISGSVKMESAESDLNSLVLIVTAAKNIEGLVLEELEKMNGDAHSKSV